MSDKSERRRQTSGLKREKAIRDKLIADLLNRPDGRSFIWWLLTIGKFSTQPFAADPNITAFSCGELNVGQQIFAAVIEADPAGFLRMQQEINNARSDPEPDPDASSDGDTIDA
jgi:hypothetical protein